MEKFIIWVWTQTYVFCGCEEMKPFYIGLNRNLMEKRSISDVCSSFCIYMRTQKLGCLKQEDSQNLYVSL